MGALASLLGLGPRATYAVTTDSATPADEGCLSVAERKWRRIVASLPRIRRLMRIWGNLGQHLQQFDGNLRERLQDVYPKTLR